MKTKFFKKTALISLASLSIAASSFALDNLGVSQSYYVTEKGRPVSVKSEVPADLSMWSTLYSPDGFFYQKELVKHFGSKYIILNNANQVHTIDSRGDFYKGITQYMDGKLKYTGANYFITKKGQLYIVKSNGELVKHSRQKDEPKLKRLALSAGMFVIPSRSGKIGIINPFNGTIDYKPIKPLSPFEHKGDNFAITTEGGLITVGFSRNPDGSYDSSYNELALPSGVKSITKLGGNFFIDQDHKVHTINDEGKLSLEGTAIEGYAHLKPKHIGGNYLVYPDGAMFLIDEYGEINYLNKITDTVLVTNKS